MATDARAHRRIEHLIDQVGRLTSSVIRLEREAVGLAAAHHETRCTAERAEALAVALDQYLLDEGETYEEGPVTIEPSVVISPNVFDVVVTRLRRAMDDGQPPAVLFTPEWHAYWARRSGLTRAIDIIIEVREEIGA